VWIHPDQDRNGCAQGGDLRQRKVHENDPALDDVNAQVRVNPGQDEAGNKGPN
jgi:hypothetical protein